MSCHAPPGQRGAIPVDIATHSHHQAGTPGDRCVDCHMPVTNYMVRDARRDHGFTIPDPVLTKELGVPNSCNRCHDDKSADWAIDTTVKWYGNKMERRYAPARPGDRAGGKKRRHRAAGVAGAGEIGGDPRVALGAGFAALAPWAQQADVRAFLEKSLTDESPLVRSAAVRDLSQDSESAALIKPLCDDPSRLVRLDAAWGLHDARDRTHSSYRELDGIPRHKSATSRPGLCARRNSPSTSIARTTL